MFDYKIEKTNVKISASISSKEWEEGVEKVYETSKSKFNVIGFRKGRAPKKVIEQQYGDNVFFDDTLEFFVRQTLNEFLNKNPKLEPVSYPRTALESYTINDGIKFTIEFEIMPEFGDNTASSTGIALTSSLAIK